MKNTKNKRCLTKRNKKKCCPHMDLDSKGRYAATGNSHKLKYKGNNYVFWTCCKQCGYTMLDLQKSNPKKFEKLYIKGFDKNNNLLLKHKDTQKVVQIAKINKKGGKSYLKYNSKSMKCVSINGVEICKKKEYKFPNKKSKKLSKKYSRKKPKM